MILHKLSILGDIADKHTRKLLSGASLDLYLFFKFVNAENPASHYVVANGNTILTAFRDDNGYSKATGSQNLESC